VARDAAAAGAGVALRSFEALEPAPIARATAGARGWDALADALAAVFPDAALAEGLMLGNTDTRHFWALADDIYRHCPVSMTVADTAMFHGKDERIAVDQLPLLAGFYAAVLLASASD
jgi:carboxypeptidase PM20D1